MCLVCSLLSYENSSGYKKIPLGTRWVGEMCIFTFSPYYTEVFRLSLSLPVWEILCLTLEKYFIAPYFNHNPEGKSHVTFVLTFYFLTIPSELHRKMTQLALRILGLTGKNLWTRE